MYTLIKLHVFASASKIILTRFDFTASVLLRIAFLWNVTLHRWIIGLGLFEEI